MTCGGRHESVPLFSSAVTDHRRATGWPDDREGEFRGRIEATLAVGDSNAGALSAEIAGVFKKIGAGETMLQAAREAGGDAAKDITAAIGSLAGDVIDMRFLVDD